jgi:hypothetical protein
MGMATLAKKKMFSSGVAGMPVGEFNVKGELIEKAKQWKDSGPSIETMPGVPTFIYDDLKTLEDTPATGLFLLDTNFIHWSLST